MLRLLLALAALQTPDYSTDQRQAAMDYVPARQRLGSLLAAGDVEGAERLFLDTVPAEKRTAAHYTMLGDAFSAFDPAFASAQHAKAFELAPDEPQVAQAWASDLHRAGKCAEAEPLFARVAGSRADVFAAAQRIDCLVRTGRLAEALESWRAVRGSPVLAKAFRIVPDRIGAGPTREQRRFELRRALTAGTDSGAEELVFLDLVHLGGPRRFEVDRFELDLDRRLVGTRLDPQGRRAQELWTVCDFWYSVWERGFPPALGGEFAAKSGERMRALGWLDAGCEVPLDPLVARWATTALLESGLRKPADLLADWERALSSRLEEGEADAGRALLEIQRAAESAQAAETEQLLWTRAHDLGAALALLERRADRLESSDPLLREALARFPSSSRLAALASGAARREGKGEREALAREISACFQPPGDFEGVQSAFERLESLLVPEHR